MSRWASASAHPPPPDASAMDKSLNGDSAQPQLVRAKFAFNGKNNDELCFAKGDVMTLTQQPAGGWWEATLGERTAWFPSNYVALIEAGDAQLRGQPQLALPKAASNRPVYREMVLKDLVDAETVHVNKLRTLLTDVLEPIKHKKILPGKSYQTLVGNLEAVIRQQSSLLDALRANAELPSLEQRVGGEMMSRASALKTQLREYASNHPAAVQVMGHHLAALEALLESRGSSRVELVSGLSLAFRHLHKYPTTLQELERNLEESHPDRGDTQRAVHVFRGLQEACEAARKAAETQLELLDGDLRGWEGGRDALDRLGRVVALAPVLTIDDGADFTALLFAKPALLLLQRGPDSESYDFKELLQLRGCSVSRPPGAQKLLRLSSGQSLGFGNSEELNKWLEALGELDGVTLDESCALISPTSPTKIITGRTELSPVQRVEVRGPEAVAKSAPLPSPLRSQRLNHEIGMIDPESFGREPTPPPAQQPKGRQLPPPRVYNHYCLLPHPAPRGNAALDPTKTDIRLRKRAGQITDEEDAQILRVVEAFCSSAVAATNAVAENPSILVAEDEKMMVEEVVGDEVVVTERSLVDTVYALKDQLGAVREELADLRRALDKETRARRKAENELTHA